jgi:hypothetical protein
LKRLTARVLCFVISVSCMTIVCASLGSIHGQDMRRVLIGASYLNDDMKKKLSILESATSLTIDKFQNDKNDNSWKKLSHSVPGMPASVEEIKLNAHPTNHRKYTHRGWHYDYKNDDANPKWATIVWPKRQQILRASVEYVFDFNRRSSFFDRIYMGKNEKREAFCILLYCTHLLGDHRECTVNTYPRNKEDLMPIAGADHETTIISDLLKAFEVLFPDQDYSELVRKLETENIKIRALLYDESRMKTEEGIIEYTKYADGIIDIMSQHVPRLLQNEEFFKVFHPPF